MSLKTELRDQSAHFGVGFSAVMFMVFFMSVNVIVAALITVCIAIGREAWQRIKKGDKWYDCGPGCRLDLIFWALGIGLAVALNFTGVV